MLEEKDAVISMKDAALFTVGLSNTRTRIRFAKFASASLGTIQSEVCSSTPLPSDYLDEILERPPLPAAALAEGFEEATNLNLRSVAVPRAGAFLVLTTAHVAAAALEQARAVGGTVDEVTMVQPLCNAIMFGVVRAVFPMDRRGRFWLDLTRNHPPLQPGKSPSLVDALLMLDTKAGSVASLEQAYKPSEKDVDCLSLPMEFKISLESNVLRYRAVAQVTSWMFHSNETYGAIERGAVAIGIISDGLSFRRVTVRRRPDLPRVDPATLPGVTDFEKFHELTLSAPVVFASADLQPGKTPPAAFETLCQWVSQILHAMRAAAEARALSHELRHPEPIVVLDEATGVKVPLKVEVGHFARTPRGTVRAGQMPDGAKVTCFLMRGDDCLADAARLRRIQERCGGSDFIPRVVACGHVTDEWLRVARAGWDHLLVTDVVGEALSEHRFLLDPHEAAALLSDVGEALHALARARTVHRDVKPSNVVRRPAGGFALIDFDLSASLDDWTGVAKGQTDISFFAGTPAFASTSTLTGHAPAVADDWESLLYTALARLDGAQGDEARAWLESDRCDALCGDDMDARRGALQERLEFASAAVFGSGDFVARAHRADFEAAVRRAERSLAGFDEWTAEELARGLRADNAFSTRMRELMKQHQQRCDADTPDTRTT